MKIFGLFKVIDKNKNSEISFELFNLLHPDKQLNDLSSIDLEPKTFFNFFYEDNPVFLKAGVNIQYMEYCKFKKELEQLTSKKSFSEYDYEMISKMILKMVTAENRFIEYKEKEAELEKMESYNQLIIDELYSSQLDHGKNVQKYLDIYYNCNEFKIAIPENLKLLFDNEHVRVDKYKESIMYPDDIISFYRTNVKYTNDKIILDNNDGNRIEYIVFEAEMSEVIDIKPKGTDLEKIKKLNTIIELCSECNLPIPKKIILKLNSMLKLVNFKYNGKNLFIYPVDKDEKEIIYEISINLSI